jgi:transketolase C-terminal domain/subunit
VDEHRKGGDLKVVARGAMTIESLEALEQELKDLLSMLGTPQTD